jgi:hypothetical protein
MDYAAAAFHIPTDAFKTCRFDSWFNALLINLVEVYFDPRFRSVFLPKGISIKQHDLPAFA